MNRQPILAHQFAEAILEDMLEVHEGDWFQVQSGSHEARAELLARWETLILERFTSDSIPFTGRKGISTEDPEVAEKFLLKYPQLRALDDLVRAEALRRWPTAEFSYRVLSDPEGCHICCEGQKINLLILTDHAIYGESGKYDETSPHRNATEEWEDWMWGPNGEDSEYLRLERSLGDVARLFRPELLWKATTEEG